MYGTEWIEEHGEYTAQDPIPAHEHDGYSSGF